MTEQFIEQPQDHYVLRCMYLDLRDLTKSHSKKTPEIKLLESRIEELEKGLGLGDTMMMRALFDVRLYEVQKLINSGAFGSLKDVMNLTDLPYETASDFFKRLRVEAKNKITN